MLPHKQYNTWLQDYLLCCAIFFSDGPDALANEKTSSSVLDGSYWYSNVRQAFVTETGFVLMAKKWTKPDPGDRVDVIAESTGSSYLILFPITKIFYL